MQTDAISRVLVVPHSLGQRAPCSTVSHIASRMRELARSISVIYA